MTSLIVLAILIKLSILLALLSRVFKNAKRILATENKLALAFLFPFRLIKNYSGEAIAIKGLKLIAILGIVAVLLGAVLELCIALNRG